MFSSSLGLVAKGSSSSSKLPKYSASGKGLIDQSKRPWFVSLLVAVKLCYSLAIFMLADFIHLSLKSFNYNYNDHKFGPTKSVVEGSAGLFGSWGPILQILAFIQLICGVTYVSVQKPFLNWTKHPISPWKWMRILRHSAVTVLLLLIWSHGLLMSGSFRTIFLSSHYDFTLAGIIAGIFVSKSGPRLRGGVLFIAGVMVLLLFDDISVFEENHHRPTRSVDSEKQVFLSKNSVGIMTLLCYLVMKLGFDAFSKSLAVDVGGLKRLHALSTLASGIMLIFLIIMDFIAGAALIPVWSNFFSLVFITVFGFVLNYYVDTICLKRMETCQVAKIGSTASHFSALIYSLVWISSNEVPSVATLTSFALIYLGTFSLTMSERASGGGTLVGYSTDGHPLFNFSSHFSGDNYSPMWKQLLRLGISFFKQIQEDATSKRIFYYFLLTIGFTGVEFLYGAITNSLGLITDGFHMLFDAMAICIGLCASVMCRWKPTPTFPFGYGRVEVLSGFLNAFFLLVVAGAISIEAWARLFDPPSVDAHRILPISIVGLVVNLIGIYAFRNGSADHSHAHDNANIRGVFLHVLADTMGSIGVIVSSLLIKHFGLLVADPICSLVIAALIVITALPLLKDTAKVLLLTVPSGLERNLQQVVLQILATEGVKGYKTLRFWAHAPQILTGSINIQATQDANEQQVIRHVNNLFASIGFSHFTTQVEKDEFIARRNQGDEDDPIGYMRGFASARNINGSVPTMEGIGPLNNNNNNDTNDVRSDQNINTNAEARLEIDLA